MSQVAQATASPLSPARHRLALPAGLVAGVALAELLVAVGATGAGLLVDVGLVLALANGVLFTRSRARAGLLSVLALVPLVRPVATAMSFDGVPPGLAPVLAGAPLLAAVLWASHTLDFPLGARLLPASRAGAKAAVLAGALLGAPAYVLAGPDRPELGAPGLLLAVVGLVLFVALQQEILFRGLLQRLLTEAYGPRTDVLIALNAMFAATLLGTSLAFAVFMGAVGMAFSEFVRRSGTLGEVVIAHSVLIVFVLLLWPLMLG